MSFHTVRGMGDGRFCHTPAGVCSLGLNLAWCAEYRRRIPGGCVAARCGQLPEQIGARHGWQIVAKEVMPDHVHLFVGVGPTDAPVQVVRVYKGHTARVLRAEFGHLRDRAELLWSPSSFAAWVGSVAEWTARPSIEHRWDAAAS